MAWFLGIDTSNYTTSAALYESETKSIFQQKKLLDVQKGAVGLRQSDAVFSHVKQLGELMERLFEHVERVPIAAVGVSVRPRDAQGSYMPCFMVGRMAAQLTAASHNIPLHEFSHQAGHIAAALYSSGKLSLIGTTFAAFHLSGGTTDGLIVEPDDEHVFAVTQFCCSLDLKAGQAVDRVGAMLGLGFPAGPQLEKLALECETPVRVKPVMKGENCSLSGIENKCRRMIDDGEAPCVIARFCIESILAALCAMTQQIKDSRKEIPIVYSGGVMSNVIIRREIEKRYGGFFAAPEFSSDNAAGVALLSALSAGERV